MALLTGREAGALVGVSPSTIRQWVYRGYLKAEAVTNELGAPHLYDEDEVRACDEFRRQRLHREVGR